MRVRTHKLNETLQPKKYVSSYRIRNDQKHKHIQITLILIFIANIFKCTFPQLNKQCAILGGRPKSIVLALE